MRLNVAGPVARAAWGAIVVVGIACHAAPGDGHGPQSPALKTEAVPTEAAGAAAATGGEPGEGAMEQKPQGERVAQDPDGDAEGEPAGLPAPPDVAAPPKDARRSPKGVLYKVLKAGKGGPKPTPQDTVKVHYTGWTTDGKMFDSSVQRGEPAEFPLGALIPGWVDAIPFMSVGDTMRLWIPEELAYKGKPGTPQGMLVFDVELLAIGSRP